MMVVDIASLQRRWDCGLIELWSVLGSFLVRSTFLSWRVLSICGVKLIIDPRGLSLVGWVHLAVSLV